MHCPQAKAWTTGMINYGPRRLRLGPHSSGSSGPGPQAVSVAVVSRLDYYAGNRGLIPAGTEFLTGIQFQMII